MLNVVCPVAGLRASEAVEARGYLATFMTRDARNMRARLR